MNPIDEISIQFELHSPDGIQRCLSEGLSANAIYKGKLLIYELINMYTRSPRFKDCVMVLLNNGLVFEDKTLLAVLTDDAASLNEILANHPEKINNRYSFQCAYTPLHEATLLHICAEYNHVACAQVLVNYGADVNAKAGMDEHGFGGQTPIFHTVNQNLNQSADMMNFLLDRSADLKITVPGFIWGRGYDWETFIPAVNPIGYAMMGLLPQVHRNEKTIASVISLLTERAYGIKYQSANIPNAYLKK